MNNDNKFLFIFIGVVAFMVLFMGFYLYSSFSSGSSSKAKMDVNKSKILTKDSVNINEDRVKSYTSVDSMPTRRLNLNLSKVKFKNKKADSLNVETTAQEQTPKTRASSYRERKEVKTIVVYDTVKPVAENTPKKPSYRNTMSVSISSEGSTANSNKSEKTTPQDSENFIPISLEEDVTIRHGSTVVFIAKSDFIMNSVKILKNAYVYCKASYAEGRFYLSAFQVRQPDGNVFQPNGYSVYDDRFSKGFEVEGKVNKAVKEATQESARDNNISTYTPNTGVNAGINLIKKAVQKTGTVEPIIQLYGGYNVYLKKD